MQKQFHLTVSTFVVGLLAASAIFAGSVLLGDGARAADKPLTVVELYTSQGCSSCPPADAKLGQLAEREDIIALSFHVDYWDYIGWKDRFASPAFTQRQRDYARTMSGRYVYTPQMVIQGQIDAIGSDQGAINRALAKAATLPRVPVELTLDKVAKRVTISIPAFQTMENHAVLLAFYDDSHATEIKRGENAGQTLRYHHVVRSIQSVASWRGKPIIVPVDLAKMSAGKPYACAVLLQSRETGRIIGAAKLEISENLW